MAGSQDFGDIDLYESCISDIKKAVRKLKSDYSDLINSDIVEIQDEIKKAQQQFDDLQSSSDFQKASKKTRNSPKGSIGCISRLFFLFSIIILPILCFVLL